MASEITNEGVKLGELLLGSVNEEAPEMLWVVTRIIGKSKVEALAATRDLEVRITIRTAGINGEDHQFQRVRFASGNIGNKKRVGSLIEF